MQEILGYTKWDNFKSAIEKAKKSCINAGIPVSDHFADVGKMVKLGSNSQREIDDIALTRYACYKEEKELVSSNCVHSYCFAAANEIIPASGTTLL